VTELFLNNLLIKMKRKNNGIEKSQDKIIIDGPPLPQYRDSEILLTMREPVNTERKILD
jgi:hypothetical protein